MKNSSGEIIYIGKAKNLKNRVSSYFMLNHEKGSKVEKLVQNISFFDYIVTDSEFEALVLECSLIKKHQPKYNILLKDSKGYSYIKITNETWPKILCAKQKIKDGSVYIGPYVSSFSVKKTVEEILKIFKLPNCERDLRRTYKNPCLNFYINMCSGPCVRKISHQDYIESINEAKNFLNTGIDETLLKLKGDMLKASENMEFELAAKLRDKIEAIRKMKSKQKVVAYDSKNADIIAVAADKTKTSVHIFRFKNGDLCESENFIINADKSESEIRGEFLKQFYSSKDEIPKTIFLDGEIKDFDLIEKFLSEKKGETVKIKIPKRSKAFKLVKMCKNNAGESLLKESGFNTKEGICLKELENTLNLKNIPRRIEAYDISNLFGSDCVAAMVVFKDGKASKIDYRRFNLGYMQDDFNAMKTVLRRRFNELKNENPDSSFSQMPDLILVDGGFGQVRAGKEILNEMGYEVALYGMVKDKKHRTRGLTTESDEIVIRTSGRLFLFITSIQDEVHRFAVNYHRNLRSKKLKTSELQLIKGVGEKRSKSLLKKFKSIKNISDASVDELSSVKGISGFCAETIYNHFHNRKS